MAKIGGKIGTITISVNKNLAMIIIGDSMIRINRL